MQKIYPRPRYVYLILNCSICGKLVAQSKVGFSGELDLLTLQTEEAKQLQKLHYELKRNITHPRCAEIDSEDRAYFFAEWLNQRINLMKESGLEEALAQFEKEIKGGNDI